jgi:hypothetical protein
MMRRIELELELPNNKPVNRCERRENATRDHNEEWREAVKTRTGGYPMMQYFDLFLLIDNEHGRVTAWTADGKALSGSTVLAATTGTRQLTLRFRKETLQCHPRR